MALANMGFNEKFGLILEDQKPWRERGESKRREEEEEEEDGGAKIKPTRYGTLDFCMVTHLGYEFYEIWHGSLGLYDD